jgi:hypothetical protein
MPVSFFTPAAAKPDAAVPRSDAVVVLGNAKGAETYIVQLADAPVGLRATLPKAQRASSVNAYRGELRDQQADALDSIGDRLGTKPVAQRRYTDAVNGFALKLTRDQARRVGELPGVRAVHVDVESQLHTYDGPSLISADQIWDGSHTDSGVATQGEGMVVGIIDSGINSANRAFHASVPPSDGGDGYTHTNPRGTGNYLGMCDPAHASYRADVQCNAKLIGVWNFTSENLGSDSLGHGTHVASTAVGNRQKIPGTDSLISGVAPHANLISYDVCVSTCAQSATLAAYDQAIRDGVDVINMSIGSTDLTSVSDPWTSPVGQAMLTARTAGIHVAISAGNNGRSGSSTVTSYGDILWATASAATSHRVAGFSTSMTVTTSTGGTTDFGTKTGLGGGPMGLTMPATIVDATQFGSGAARGQCFAEDLASADLTGAVVLCDRGTTDRTAKAAAVAARGAVGVILANVDGGSDTINVDPYVIPAAHLTHQQATALRATLAANAGAKAALSGAVLATRAADADLLADFSSRGPNRASDSLAPAISAPGVNIMAAYGTHNAEAYGLESGTSMASPHTAGAMALLADLKPQWTPAQLQSALMTTANSQVRDTDGSPATWHEQGSGRIDLAAAASAGFVLDVATDDFVAANPADGGDVRTLNLAAAVDSRCVGSCEFTRHLRATDVGEGTWTVTAQSPSGVTVQAPSSITLTSARATALTFTVNLSQVDDEWKDAKIILTPPAGSQASKAHLAVTVLAADTNAAPSSQIATARVVGSADVPGLRVMPGADIKATGIAVPQRQQRSAASDVTPSTPLDSPDVATFTVPADATVLEAVISDAQSADLDLYMGTGSTPSAQTLKCQSYTWGSNESCRIANPSAGTWWILIHGYEANTGDRYTLTTTTTGQPGDVFSASAHGSGVSQAVRATFDLDEFEPGASVHAFIASGADKALTRVQLNMAAAPDVEVDVQERSAGPEDQITFAVTVNPSAAPGQRVYRIADESPAGTQVVASSVKGAARATVSGRTVTWRGTYAQLAAATSTPTGQPVRLSYTATLGADAREGDALTRSTEHSIEGDDASTITAQTPVTVTAARPVPRIGLALSASKVAAGGKVKATATLTNIGAGAPTGTVEFYEGTRRVASAAVNTRTATASAWITAGSTLKRRTLTARYTGNQTYRPAQSSARALTVTAPPKASARVKVSAPSKVKTGTKNKYVTVRVTRLGSSAKGRVRVTIKQSGVKAVNRTVTLKSGRAKAKLPTFKRARTAKVTVRYLGNSTTKTAHASKRISVRQR